MSLCMGCGASGHVYAGCPHRPESPRPSSPPATVHFPPLTDRALDLIAGRATRAPCGWCRGSGLNDEHDENGADEDRAVLVGEVRRLRAEVARISEVVDRALSAAPKEH